MITIPNSLRAKEDDLVSRKAWWYVTVTNIIMIMFVAFNSEISAYKGVNLGDHLAKTLELNLPLLMLAYAMFKGDVLEFENKRPNLKESLTDIAMFSILAAASAIQIYALISFLSIDNIQGYIDDSTYESLIMPGFGGLHSILGGEMYIAIAAMMLSALVFWNYRFKTIIKGWVVILFFFCLFLFKIDSLYEFDKKDILYIKQHSEIILISMMVVSLLFTILLKNRILASMTLGLLVFAVHALLSSFFMDKVQENVAENYASLNSKFASKVCEKGDQKEDYCWSRKALQDNSVEFTDMNITALYALNGQKYALNKMVENFEFELVAIEGQEAIPDVYINLIIKALKNKIAYEYSKGSESGYPANWLISQYKLIKAAESGPDEFISAWNEVDEVVKKGDIGIIHSAYTGVWKPLVTSSDNRKSYKNGYWRVSFERDNESDNFTLTSEKVTPEVAYKLIFIPDNQLMGYEVVSAAIADLEEAI